MDPKQDTQLVGPEITIRVQAFRTPDMEPGSVVVMLGALEGGTPLLLSGPAWDNRERFAHDPALMAAKLMFDYAQRLFADAQAGTRRYSVELIATPEPSGPPGANKLDLKTTLHENTFDPDNPLHNVMASVSQFLVSLLNTVVKKNANLNKTLRPAGDLDRDPSEQAGGQDPQGPR